MSDLQHLSAVITLADAELHRDEWESRTGVFHALLDQAMPHLRALAAQLQAKESRLALLKLQQATKELEQAFSRPRQPRTEVTA